MNNDKQVLIIDESTEMRKRVVNALGKYQDFNCIEVQSGHEALDALENKDVSLILANCKLSRMDTSEFLRELKLNSTWKLIPVIITTCDGGRDNYVSGAHVYLTHPFKEEELYHVVNALRHWHLN